MASGIFSRNEVKKRHNLRHKEKGLCVRCSKKVVEGQVLCEYHREINRQNMEKKCEHNRLNHSLGADIWVCQDCG